LANGKDEYTSNGKQVLLNGWHYADAFDEEAANAIAYALNSVYLAKVGPVHVRDPICPACKGVGMHAHNCTEGR
jgi:hypothetical protein